MLSVGSAEDGASSANPAVEVALSLDIVVDALAPVAVV